MKLSDIKQCFLDLTIPVLFRLFWLFPLQNKVVATTMRGRRYSDNPRYILEKLHEIDPSIKCVWIRNGYYRYIVPSWMESANRNNIFRYVYEYATSKVWIDTHHIRCHLRKRRGQLFIETWHGGLGIKKIEGDLSIEMGQRDQMELRHTNQLADVFISNSDHLSSIYRSAFGYKGPIYKCGYPKNEIAETDTKSSMEVRQELGISGKNVLLYAPTFRESFVSLGIVDMSVYNIDFSKLYEALKYKSGSDWVILIKWHPTMSHKVPDNYCISPFMKDVTEYDDMQGLIQAADIMISDYSSCIFDAAELGLPCFTYTSDFEEYKKERGVYYDMVDLPFPNSTHTAELINKVNKFDYQEYLRKWVLFKQKVGLVNNGNSAEMISKKIIEHIEGLRIVEWN